MPNEQKPRRRKKPVRKRRIRVTGPGWVRLTDKGCLVFIADSELPGAKLRFNPPQGQAPD